MKNIFRKILGLYLIIRCNFAIKKQIDIKFRNEAKQIIKLTTNDIRKEFLKYHKNNNGNICCMVLDKAKNYLVSEKKIKLNVSDAFGKQFMM